MTRRFWISAALAVPLVALAMGEMVGAARGRRDEPQLGVGDRERAAAARGRSADGQPAASAGSVKRPSRSHGNGTTRSTALSASGPWR